ncbi:hypothetical protein [Paraburkholderia diazotrophica]|uniref:hypothetical protein n=1 Tax=Paraburkholderia diazotrophica TaxID=667676 RepID=UPI00115FDD25|nr:hypothetical protein [Paraburkholderia diazotrophica]
MNHWQILSLVSGSADVHSFSTQARTAFSEEDAEETDVKALVRQIKKSFCLPLSTWGVCIALRPDLFFDHRQNPCKRTFQQRFRKTSSASGSNVRIESSGAKS